MNDSEAPRSPGRRRLAKGAFAVPTVLASISTKNALGATYGCTISGVMSGNTSPGKATGDTNCSSGFMSLADWQQEYVANGPKAAESAPEWFGVKFESSNGSSVGATIHQILWAADGVSYGSAGKDMVVLTMVVYLNASRYPDYHVSAADVEELFSVVAGQRASFERNGKSWNKPQVETYLMLLAGGVNA
ncbi:hypothetical protein [Pseudorhodoferax sp.]|uniref:hypothetical protein n=1 Tax=Pseudorhodoferax sp. TaxID=1993553 RepID=UPI0039E64A25